MAALRYILLAAAITLTLALLAHLVLPARGPIPRRTGRRGRLCIAALTAVYAVAAFFSLGSARDPQQFCSFEAGESAVLALERESEISAVWYYPGLSTGEYTLAYSTDGMTFTPAGTMPQGYADLFKWLQPEMADTAPATAAYVRITASAHVELGEADSPRRPRTLRPTGQPHRRARHHRPCERGHALRRSGHRARRVHVLQQHVF